VVSVGNLAVGGTGKTVCVELLARKLLARGKRVAILSRGYGGRPGEYVLGWDQGRLLCDGVPVAASDGLADEPQVLAQHLPGVMVWVGARREKTGRAACARGGCDVLLLDDGFQHRRVQRTLDVVLVRADMPPGGKPLLPRGPMREPLSALRRAHVVILTKSDEAWDRGGALRESLRRWAPQATVASASHVPMGLWDVFSGERHDVAHLGTRRVGLVSSIGDPRGFEATVSRCEASIAWHAAWPDHHRYGEADWEALATRASREPLDAVVTTEKDWVRLAPVVAAHRSQRPPAVPLFVLRVEMAIVSGTEELDARLAGL
jgi:tetraacyldisaccharide 4'-kinase